MTDQDDISAQRDAALVECDRLLRAQAEDKALITTLIDHCEAWKALAEGRSLLLNAYRRGKLPSQKAWDLIKKAREVLGTEKVP